MSQPWVSIDLEADQNGAGQNAPAKMLPKLEGPSPWPELGLLSAQSELRLQLFPTLEARHTTESTALLKAHKSEREALDQRYAEDSCTLEARHIAERAGELDQCCGC